MRLLDLPSFTKLQPPENPRLVLGNPPPPVLQKEMKMWIQEATPLCGEFARALRAHITTVQMTQIDMSSDDESASSSSSDDDLTQIHLPPRFELASTVPLSVTLEPLNPAGQSMIGQHILYKWPKCGWCTGRITDCNDNPKTKVGKMIANFTVLYLDDNTSGPHCLSLANYNANADDDAPNHMWIMINPSP